MTEPKKRSRDICPQRNEVFFIGRACAESKQRESKATMYVVMPAYKKGGGIQWIRYVIDVTGDKQPDIMKIKVGDYVSGTAKISERKGIEDDNGDMKSVKVLQLDEFRSLTITAPEVPVPEGYDARNPSDEAGFCVARVELSGRHFIGKKALERGEDKPVLREGKGNRPYTYVKVTYEDPFQPQPEGEGYFDKIFFDVSINGREAEHASKYCKNRAYISLSGELGVQATDWTKGSKTTNDVTINVRPGGFSFFNQGDGNFTPKTQQGITPSTDGDTEGLEFDGDPKTETPAAEGAPAAEGGGQDDGFYDDDLPF